MPKLTAPSQAKEQAAVRLAKAFAAHPQATGKALHVFLVTLIREWDEESVRRLVDAAAEQAERTC